MGFTENAYYCSSNAVWIAMLSVPPEGGVKSLMCRCMVAAQG